MLHTGRTMPRSHIEDATREANRAASAAARDRFQKTKRLMPPKLGARPRWSIGEAAALLGISPSLVEKRRREGKLATVKDGKRVFITDDEVRRYSKATDMLNAAHGA